MTLEAILNAERDEILQLSRSTARGMCGSSAPSHAAKQTSRAISTFWWNSNLGEPSST